MAANERRHGAAMADWWTEERRQAASQRAKAWHDHQRATDPHLIARREAKEKGWPFSPLPHRRREHRA
jgi:hypothetical protein